MKVKDWIANFKRNIPTKYPVLMCGWPDAEHDITHSRYLDHCVEIVEDVLDGGDVPLLPSFSQWKTEKREENEERDVLGFSWQVCDLCGALPGERHAVTGYQESFPDCEDGDYFTLSVCADCLCYIANGDLPEE